MPATMVTVPGSAAATGSGLAPLAAGHRRTAIATMTSRAITPTTRRRRPDGGATGPAWTSHGPDGVMPAIAGDSGGGGGSAGGGAAEGDAGKSASAASRGVRSSATRPPPAARDRVGGDRGAVRPGPGDGASPTTRSPCRRTRPTEPRHRPSDAPREYTGGSPEAPAGASRDPRTPPSRGNVAGRRAGNEASPCHTAGGTMLSARPLPLERPLRRFVMAWIRESSRNDA